ncbi:MAG TPA: N-acetylmuramic acid 6-phosphate etherase [Allosphingosinicella sp.]|nr:N-acetylmuramic acid 6-phosphate etherase [Allosphingosinicella sp.]
MSTESISERFADLDLWPTRDAVSAMLEEHLAAAAVVQAQAEAIARAAEDAAGRLSDPDGRLIYVGAGTSGRLAAVDGVELGPTFDWRDQRLAYLLAGGRDALLASVEGAEDDAAAAEAAMRDLAPTPGDVVIGVAASGRTPYTIAAVRAAASAGALTIGLANNADTPLLEAVAHPILLDTGAEIVAGSTRMKAGTAQKIALNTLSTAVMLRLGRVYKGLMINMRLTNRKLQGRAVEMICDIAHVDRSAAEDALERADGDIKLAALIALGGTPQQGAASLEAAGGNLRTAIEQLSGRS